MRSSVFSCAVYCITNLQWAIFTHMSYPALRVVHLWVPEGGTPWKMGYRYVRPWRTPFHDLPRPLFQHFFSSQAPTFTQKLQILKASKNGKEFSSRASNWAKLQFTRLNFVRNSVHKGPKFSSGPFTSPSVQPFGPHIYTKMKVECLPRALDLSNKFWCLLLHVYVCFFNTAVNFSQARAKYN